MKKIRLLSCICVISAMLMGAAYANWNEGFAVSSTVDTGFLEIQVTPGSISQVKYMDTSIEGVENSNDLKVLLSDLYPGAEVVFDFKMKNTGTMAIKLDDIDLVHENLTDRDLTDDQTLLDHLTLTYSDNGHQFEPLDVFLAKVRKKEVLLREETRLFVKVQFDLDQALSGDQMELESVDLIFTIGYKQFNVYE